jgi:hypothetical protein
MRVYMVFNREGTRLNLIVEGEYPLVDDSWMWFIG